MSSSATTDSVKDEPRTSVPSAIQDVHAPAARFGAKKGSLSSSATTKSGIGARGRGPINKSPTSGKAGGIHAPNVSDTLLRVFAKKAGTNFDRLSIGEQSVVSLYSEDFIYNLLKRYNYYLPGINVDDPNFCMGLEVLTGLQEILIVKREIIPDDDLDYQAFCQYDIMNVHTRKNVALALERTNCCSVCCYRDSRVFSIRVFNYHTEKCFRISRQCSLKYFFTQFCCCCWVCCSGGLGNEVIAYDCDNEILGSVRQCDLFSKSMNLLRDQKVEDKEKRGLSFGEFFTDMCGAWRHVGLTKFQMYDAEQNAGLRIEEANEILFKFIRVGDKLDSVGYIQKLGANKLRVKFPDKCTEKQIAVIIAACFLIDHTYFEISTESSYMRVDDMRDGHRKSAGWCRRFCKYNRCRNLPLIFFFFILLGGFWYLVYISFFKGVV